jgi:hypothetical protein
MPSLPFDKLNETNYDDWKIQMEALLEEKGLFGVVSGRDILPTTGPNSKGVKTFLEKQRLARSKIILSIEPSQLPHVRNEEDPCVIWQNLTRIHRARGLGILLTMRMDFLRMSMPLGSTIASYVASIRHAAYRLEECYQAEEDDSVSVSPIFSPSIPTTRLPIVSNLDKISVLLNGLPPAYQPVIVNITGTPLASLTFEDVVTRLMNEEGRLRNIVSPTTTTPSVTSDSHDEVHVFAAMHAPKGKSFKSAPSKDMSKVRCHKCGGVGHFRHNCPTHDSDAANIAVADDDQDEEQAFTAIIADEIEEAW